METLAVGSVFLSIFLLVWGVGSLVWGGRESEVLSRLRRLREPANPAEHRQAARPRGQALKGLYEGLVGVLARLIPSAEDEKLRQQLAWAGDRRENATRIFFAKRILLSLALGVLFSPPAFLATGKPAAGMLAFVFMALLGFLLPVFLLGSRVRRRQLKLTDELPNVLDLLVVSVEAGLGLDIALQRVGHEVRTSCPVLSGELHILNLEMKAGKTRAEALRNLAWRTGVEDLSALIAMLIQAEKFGTSVAASLEIYSDELRTKRRQRAEAAAAAMVVKLIFPLVFFIFPALFVVLLGPGAIQIYNQFMVMGK
ncbi:MAG: type II secretion system F family protein [Nitrospinota bacterium]